MLHADLGRVPNPSTGRAAPALRRAVCRRAGAVRAAVAPLAGTRRRDAARVGMTLRYAFSAARLCIRGGCHARSDRVGKRY